MTDYLDDRGVWRSTRPNRSSRSRGISTAPGERERQMAQRFHEEADKALAAIGAATSDDERASLTAQAAEFRQMADEQLKGAEFKTMRTKAKELRKAFREKFAKLAGEYKESQDEKYPEEYRAKEGDRLLRAMSMAEAELQVAIVQWTHGQKVEAARLRHVDPVGDQATETRRLREMQEVDQLAAQYPTKTQAGNTLIPLAREFLANGNVDRASVFLKAAVKSGAYDGTLERDLNTALDRVVPNRRQAVEIEVAAQDEFELAMKDVADQRVLHKVGDAQEQVRASTAAKMAAYRREREAKFLLEESNIELPTEVN